MRFLFSQASVGISLGVFFFILLQVERRKKKEMPSKWTFVFLLVLSVFLLSTFSEECLMPFHMRDGFFNGLIPSIHECEKHNCSGFSYPYKANFQNCEKDFVAKNLPKCHAPSPSPTPFHNYEKYQELFDFTDEDCGVPPQPYDIFLHFRQGDFKSERHKRANTPHVWEVVELVNFIRKNSNLTSVYVETDGEIGWALEQNYTVSKSQERLGIARNCTIQAIRCGRDDGVCMAKELLCILGHAHNSKLVIGTLSSSVFRVLCSVNKNCFDWSGLHPFFGHWHKKRFKKYKFKLEKAKAMLLEFQKIHNY